MKSASVIAIVLSCASLLTACGAETATTAATVGAAKKQELEQGKQTMEQAQQKVGESMQQMQQAPARAADQ
jgi:curli biogenesis system outer membrane secretion channel CsgG